MTICSTCVLTYTSNRFLPAAEANEPISRLGHLLLSHHAPHTAQSTTARQSRTQRQLSNKQLPSHRKLRRWNNDRFINTHTGTNSSVSHPILEGEEWYQEYWMPNYPCEYRSEFAKLVCDDTKRGMDVRERFVKGEVGTRRCATRNNPAQVHALCKGDLGNQLYRKLSPRIRSILSRCTERSAILGNDHTNNRTSMAIQAISAFETYITSCILQSKKSAVPPSAGFPPLLSDEVYTVFSKVFCSCPDLVIKKNKRKMTQGSSVIPTIHFYFADESKCADEKRNGAFYRILLYAVCNFHGLVASSCTLDGKRKSICAGRNFSKGVKLVTVQSGVVLGLDLKLLDIVSSYSSH